MLGDGFIFAASQDGVSFCAGNFSTLSCKPFNEGVQTNTEPPASLECVSVVKYGLNQFIECAKNRDVKRYDSEEENSSRSRGRKCCPMGNVSCLNKRTVKL